MIAGRTLRAGRAGARLLYLMAGVPLGLGWLSLSVSGLFVGGATLVLGAGLPILLGVLVLTRMLADLDRRLQGRLLGPVIEEPLPAPSGATRTWTSSARWLLRDSRTWRSLGWMLFRTVGGVVVLTGAVASAAVLVALLVVPFRPGYLQWGDSWRSPSGWPTAWTLPVGVAGLVLSLQVIRLLAAVHVRAGQVLLSPDPSAQLVLLAQEAGRDQDRITLARDLHDGIGHAMTLVVVQAAAAGTALDRDPEFVRGALASIGDAARVALDDLDHALAALRDSGGTGGGTGGGNGGSTPGRISLLPDVPALVRQVERAGLRVDATMDGDDSFGLATPPGQELGEALARLGPLPDAVSAAGFRVVQEALTNVLRHADVGARATLSIQQRADSLQIRVRNPVSGTVRPRTGGTGLIGLRHRVETLGGLLEAGPAGIGTDGNGWWEVRAAIPLSGGGGDQ